MHEFRRLGPIVIRERDNLWKNSPQLGLQSIWEQAAGDSIASHTRVVSFRNGVMTVGCPSGAWACELRLSANDLVPRINRLRPPGKVREIRFVHEAWMSAKTRK